MKFNSAGSCLSLGLMMMVSVRADHHEKKAPEKEMPAASEKWCVIEIRGLLKKVRYEALPEPKAKARLDEFLKIYQMSFEAWKKEARESRGVAPSEPKLKIYKQGLSTMEQANNVAMERNNRVKKDGKYPQTSYE